MISRMLRIAQMIVVAGFALSSIAWAAAPCSDASLNGTYGFLHDGTDSNGDPYTAAVSQITFDSTSGTFNVETTASHDGVIAHASLTGTYTVDSNCTGMGSPTGESPFSIVVTSTGFLALHLDSEGFAVQQGSATCTDAGVEGSFGFETTGNFLAGSPAPGPVAFIGELNLTVNASGEGVISGLMAASENGVYQSFEPVTGSYTVDTNCRGRASIKAKGSPAMHFHLVIVNGGNEMLIVETDENTVVSGSLQR